MKNKCNRNELALLAIRFADAYEHKKAARKMFIEAMAAASEAGYSLIRSGGWSDNPFEWLSDAPVDWISNDALPPVVIAADVARKHWRAASAARGAALRMLLRAARKGRP